MNPSQILLHACVNEDLESAKKAIKLGANVNAKSNDCNSSALLIAVFKRNLDIVKVLIEANANLKTSNVSMYTPLVLAVRINRLDIVKLLTEAHDFSPDIFDIQASVQKKLTTPLHVAVERRNLKMVKFLLSKGASLRHIDIEQNTPIHSAVKKPNLDILNELLKHDKDNLLDQPNAIHQTPLHCAVYSHLHSIVEGRKPYPQDVFRILILRGCRVSDVKLDRSPLNTAMKCHHDDPMLIKTLIKYGIFAYTARSSLESKFNYEEGLFNSKASDQELIKHCTVVNADNLILTTVELFKEKIFYRDLINYISLCDTEIENMKRYRASRQFSLYHVLVQCLIDKNQHFFYEVEDNLSIVHHVFNALYLNEFRLYKNLIANVFSEKKLLVEMLTKYRAFTLTESATAVSLNKECLTEIAKYLSVIDLLNFTLAYFKFYKQTNIPV